MSPLVASIIFIKPLCPSADGHTARTHGIANFAVVKVFRSFARSS